MRKIHDGDSEQLKHYSKWGKVGRKQIAPKAESNLFFHIYMQLLFNAQILAEKRRHLISSFLNIYWIVVEIEMPSIIEDTKFFRSP